MRGQRTWNYWTTGYGQLTTFKHIIPIAFDSFGRDDLTLVSLLTLHRPNFCAACGNKIIRLRWRVWTSRKFCQKCAPQFRKERLQPILGGVVFLLLGVILGRAIRPPAPPLIIQRHVTAAGPTANEGAQTPLLTTDDVYLCGARTKKGTPCSRRVHGKVRCWQHTGLPSMIPVVPIKWIWELNVPSLYFPLRRRIRCPLQHTETQISQRRPSLFKPLGRFQLFKSTRPSLHTNSIDSLRLSWSS